MKKNDLNKVKKIYEGGGNIIKWLKEQEDRNQNSVDDVLISYDFQAGTYYNSYVNKAMDYDYDLEHEKIANIISTHLDQIYEKMSDSSQGISIMECGVGEATMLSGILKRVDISKLSPIFGFDISWSRIKYADKCLKETISKDAYHKVQLFTADMFHIPMKDNSIDLVYTAHSVEPNGGREKEILEELYRVSRKFLILIEPAYELAGEKERKRMLEHGYVTQLYKTALELGYQVLSYELLHANINQLNPTGVMIIKKDSAQKHEAKLCDPISRQYLERYNGGMYCKESYLAYPILQGVPCLLEDSAIIATKWGEFA